MSTILTVLVLFSSYDYVFLWLSYLCAGDMINKVRNKELSINGKYSIRYGVQLPMMC